MKKNIVCIILILMILISCKNAEQQIVVVWSSRQELARYCEMFNASQDKYKVITHFIENPSDELLNENAKKKKPDVIVGPWLKGSEVRKNFVNLNSLLKDEKIKPENFYRELLELGKDDSAQLLLPVSFNLPAIIFKKDAIKPADDFTLSLDELQKFSALYNVFERSAYTKMGFAPVWNSDFLYLIAQVYNTNFEEHGNFFSWNETSLKLAITALRKFTLDTNTSTKAETDFQFKYLYNNPYSAIIGERCLFQYVQSNVLLALDREKTAMIDFRWFMFNNKVPLDDAIIYAGIFKGGRNKAGAKEFLTFLFSPETQKSILAETATVKLSTSDFGIAGGFSSLRPITESVFPTYYPLLLSHLPQSKNFIAPHVLPSNWLNIKSNIVIPYLNIVVQVTDGADVSAFNTLDTFINGLKTKK